MVYPIKVGSTSQRILVFIQDSSLTTGAGKTGLAYNTGSLTAYYLRSDAGNANATSITLATATKGTWTSGGFVEYDATNMPGVYELGIPNAALASGASYVVIMLKGAASMAPCTILIPLLAYDPFDAVRLGLSALPNAAAAASGGLPTVDANNSVKVQGSPKKATALSGFSFVMYDTAGSPLTGLTITATRAIDGGSFASCTNSASEIGSTGRYKIDLSTSDMNGNVIHLKFAGGSGRETDIVLLTSV